MTTYDEAMQQAKSSAQRAHQLDFAETLDLSLREAMHVRKITTRRAIEMWERFEYYCDILAATK